MDGECARIGAAASARTGSRRIGFPRRSGFSLMEVVLALGIVAGVLVPLVGMLSFAVGSAREAGEAQMEARLVHELVSEVQTADWRHLSRIENQVRYYDLRGTPAGRQADAIHAAIVDFPGRGVELPGGGANPFLRQARIRVTLSRGSRPDFSGEPGPRTHRVFTTWIARRDKEALR